MQNQDMKFHDVIFKFNNYELFPTDAKEIFYNGILYDKLDFVLIILQTNGIDINCYFIENKSIFFNEIFFLFYMMLIYLYVSNGISNKYYFFIPLQYVLRLILVIKSSLIVYYKKKTLK